MYLFLFQQRHWRSIFTIVFAFLWRSEISFSSVEVFLEDCPSFDERLLLFLKWCCCCFIVVVGLQVAKCQSNKARCICLKKDISNILSGLHPHPLFSAFSSSSSAPLENGFLYCLEVFLHIQRWSLAAGCARSSIIIRLFVWFKVRNDSLAWLRCNNLRVYAWVVKCCWCFRTPTPNQNDEKRPLYEHLLLLWARGNLH